VENVELPLLVSGTAAKASREAAMRALEFVHLANRASHRPAELSGGERQRVAVARSLVNEPAIVWADEPTGALDSTNADQIMNLLRELNESSSQTFVLVTHDSKMAAYAQRIVYMVDGLIVDEKRTAHAKQPSSPTPEQT
jgi:putative ABC transport system ATP-binding protein